MVHACTLHNIAVTYVSPKYEELFLALNHVLQYCIIYGYKKYSATKARSQYYILKILININMYIGIIYNKMYQTYSAVCVWPIIKNLHKLQNHDKELITCFLFFVIFHTPHFTNDIGYPGIKKKTQLILKIILYDMFKYLQLNLLTWRPWLVRVIKKSIENCFLDKSYIYPSWIQTQEFYWK